MTNHLIVKNKINRFNKTINVSGDKSLSIRWVLFSSLAEELFKDTSIISLRDSGIESS